MGFKPAAWKFRGGFTLSFELCCLIFSVPEPPDQKLFMESWYHLTDVAPFPNALNVKHKICQSPTLLFIPLIIPLINHSLPQEMDPPNAWNREGVTEWLWGCKKGKCVS